MVEAAEQLDARLRGATAASTFAAHEQADDDDEEVVEEAVHGDASLRDAAAATLRTMEPAWGPSGTGCFMWVRTVAETRRVCAEVGVWLS